MSIKVSDNLSLLASITPLRTESVAPQQERGFSEVLDRVVGNGTAEIAAGDKARAVAELMTLQMLQTSLSLSGDNPAEAARPASLGSQFPSLETLMRAYGSGQAGSAGNDSSTVASTTPLPDISTTSGQARNSSGSGSDWLAPIIDKASRRYGVDVGLIKAVIKAESNFNPQAVSHAGARGLMQLMPATARSLGVSDPFDPEQNVMAGTRFLKDMLQRYNGDLDSALAAYNWGPGNVDRRPDRLPRETRDYQARVKQLYSSYTA